MKHRIRYILLSLLVLPGFASPVLGYKPNSSGGVILRWDKSKLPLAWYLNMNGYKGLSQADAELAFKHGMKQWSQPSCTSFRNVYKGTNQRGNKSDGHNTLLFGSLSAGSSTTAITYTRWGKTSKRYTDADIVFRTTKPWSVNPTSQQLDLRGTATHEIGHMLGLGHSSVLAATMYAKTGSGPSQRRFLDGDDIRGVCFLYPGSGTKPPECTKDSDCSAGQVCQQETCITQAEGRGKQCGSSAGGATCNQGLLCVNKAGQPAYCVEFCQNGSCPNGGKCLKTTSGSSFCACDADSDCNTGQTCRNRNCFSAQSAPCRTNADCVAPLQCIEATCQNPPAGCQSDSDCPNGQICDVGQCKQAQAKGFGEACSANKDCTSQRCEAIGKGVETYCTKRCKVGSSDCPTGYLCKAKGNDLLCFVDHMMCAQDSDCTDGKRCIDTRCKEPINTRESTKEHATEATLREPKQDEPTSDTSAGTEPSNLSDTQKAPDASTADNTLVETPPPPTGCGCQTPTNHAPLIGILLCFILFWRTKRFEQNTSRDRDNRVPRT